MKKLFLGILFLLLLSSCSKINNLILGKPNPTWIIDQKGCKHWNPSPVENETITWTEDCVNGYANGFGTQNWFKNGITNYKYIGLLKDGRRHGKGKSFWGKENNRQRVEIGIFVDGKLFDGIGYNAKTNKVQAYENYEVENSYKKFSKKQILDEQFLEAPLNKGKSFVLHKWDIPNKKWRFTNKGYVQNCGTKDVRLIHTYIYHPLFSSPQEGIKLATNGSVFNRLKKSCTLETDKFNKVSYFSGDIFHLEDRFKNRTSNTGFLEYFLNMTAKAILETPPSKPITFTRLCVSTRQAYPWKNSVKKSTVKVTGISTSYEKEDSDSGLGRDENCFYDVPGNNTYNIHSYGIDNRGKAYSFSSEISVKINESQETYCHIILDSNKIECKDKFWD